jgi:type I restriction enzyme, R subunit
MATEADTCRTLITPKLQAAGWDSDPHSIAEQRSFTDGRIIVRGNRTERRKGKRTDYLLRYTRDFPIAVVEAKPEDEPAATGIQQVKEYAEILKLKFAYATNGHTIIEFDYITGLEREIPAFPTPAQLWARLRAHEKLTDDSIAARLLTPFNLTAGKIPHYYQEIVIHRVILAILLGQRRVLLTMATGTGKTLVAFFICWILWASRWNRKNKPHRRPRILYLADRNFLVDDPKDKTFSVFGDARHKIEGGKVVFSRELYFATYQSIAKDERRPGLYKEFAPDFFDLIIVDECHRGSAKEDSNWRDILEYFAPAYQIGMTATPLRDENRDTYLYFGNPIYTYSLRQGIDDGFLAPYRVHRIVTQWDAAGWRPSKDDLDRYGREIPDEVYTTTDFERRVALRARTQAVARHLTDFLKKTDRFGKTIIFCVDQEHASEMRTALNNLNADLVQQFPDYVCRVTADEGDIGRGTRVRDDYGKLWFNILDYTGTATRNFADPAFDGDPAFATLEEIDEYGKVKESEVITPEEPEDEGGEINEPPDIVIVDGPQKERRKFYFDGGQVEIAAELVHELDADGNQLRVIKLTDYTAEKVRTLCASPDELRARWADAGQRADIIQQLAERGIDFQQVALQAGKPDADPFDLLCHLAFNAPVLTRRQRADRMKKQQAAFFGYFVPEAREILNDLLEKYASDGELQFTLPDVLKVRPISDHGNVAEIAWHFGGLEKLGKAVTQLQSLLYAA